MLLCRGVMNEVCFQNKPLLSKASFYQEPHLLKKIYLDFKPIVKLKECSLSDKDAVLPASGWSRGCRVPQLKDCGFFVHKHLPCYSVPEQDAGDLGTDLPSQHKSICLECKYLPQCYMTIAHMWSIQADSIMLYSTRGNSCEGTQSARHHQSSDDETITVSELNVQK